MLPTGGMRARFATCSKRRINAGIGNGASEIPDQDAVCLPDGGSVQGELPAADTPPPPRRDGPSRGARVPAGTRSNHRRDRLHPRFSARPAAPCPGLRAGTVACSLHPLRWCDVGTQGTGASRPLWCERPFPPLPRGAHLGHALAHAESSLLARRSTSGNVQNSSGQSTSVVRGGTESCPGATKRPVCRHASSGLALTARTPLPFQDHRLTDRGVRARTRCVSAGAGAYTEAQTGRGSSARRTASCPNRCS